MKYLVAEANNVLTKEAKSINKYLDRHDLTKEIPSYEYTINGVSRVASFQKIDYYTHFTKDFKIENPFSYHEFAWNPGRTHTKYIKHTAAFKYILGSDNIIQQELNLDIEFNLNDQKQIIIIAYIKKGLL